MAKKKRSKVKISVEVIIALLIIALIAAVACYFLVPEFKKNVDRFFAHVFVGDDRGTNVAKGESELRVHYLDVGQGDAIFIEFPDDTVMLIDSGDGRNNGETETGKYIVKYLEDLGVEVIDYLILTHSDSDHVGNMVQVLDAFEVEKAYVPYIKEGVITTKTYNNFVEAIGNETYTTDSGSTAACEIIISQMGRLIESENETDEFFMAFLSPSDKDLPGGEYDRLNASSSPSAEKINAVSPITYLEYMGKKIVFTGDVTGDPAEQVMDRYENGIYNNMFKGRDGTVYHVNFENGTDVYKAAHHGSMTHGSNSAAFIDFISPKNVVFCVEAGSYNDMPASALLKKLAEDEIAAYRTDENGTVVVTVYPDTQKQLSFYLTAQEQTVGQEAQTAALEQGVSYFVSRRKIMVNCVFAESIA